MSEMINYSIHWGCPDCGDVDDQHEVGEAKYTDTGIWTGVGSWSDHGDPDYSEHNVNHYGCGNCGHEYTEPSQWYHCDACDKPLCRDDEIPHCYECEEEEDEPEKITSPAVTNVTPAPATLDGFFYSEDEIQSMRDCGCDSCTSTIRRLSDLPPQPLGPLVETPYHG